jgi:phage-related protein
MSVVGEAHIVVRAITNRVRPDIEKAFSGLVDIGDKSGSDLNEAFNKGLSRGRGLGGGSFSKFEKEAEAARIKLRQLTQVGFFLGPAFAAVAGGIGSLGAGIVVLGAAAGAAAQGGIAILGAGIFSLVQVLLTATIAFSGVTAAISAGIKAGKGGASQAKAIESATKALARAQLNLRRILEDYPENRDRIIQAGADAEENAADAALASTRATRAYNEAQFRSQQTVKQLNKDREEAIETLQQLRFELEGGAISEKKARIEFEKARESLQRVQDLPPNSRARQEAELAFAEADLNLRKAIDRNNDLKKSEKEKDDEVRKNAATAIQDTKEYKDAKQAEADAAIDAAKAVKDAARARAEADKAASEIDSGKAFRDLNRQVADARESVKEAKASLKDAKKGSGVDAFADALKDLSPEARSFVEFIVDLKKKFKELKDAAGKDLFPALEKAIGNLVTNLFPRLQPLLQGTGKKLGEIAIDISNVITEGDNLKSLENVWKNNDKLIGDLGKVTGNLYTGFLNLLEAAGPLISRFGDWLVKVTGAWSETRKLNNESGILTDKFNRLGDITADIGEYLGIFWDGLKDIFAVVTEEGGAVDILNGYLKTAAERFRDFTSAGREDGSLKEYFNNATENFTKILGLIGNIGGELFKLGDNAGVGQFTDSLNRAVDIFGRIGDKLTGKDGAASGLGTFIEKFALMSELFTDSGSIQNFFKVLNGALDVVNAIFGNAVVNKVFLFIGAIAGIVKGFGLVLRVASFFGKAIAGVFLKFGKLFRDPFASLRKGSGLTRAELKKQMIVDAQKKKAMQGIFVSGKQAAKGLNLTTQASAKSRTALKLSAVSTNIKSKAMRGLGAAGRVAGTGLRAAGRGLMALGGPIGIILLLLPLIIENWDKIKEVIGKAVEFIVGAVTAAWDWVYEKTVGIFTSVVDFMKELPRKLLDALKALATTVLEFILKYHPIAVILRLIFENWEKIWTFFKELPGKLVEGLIGLSTTVLEFINKYHPILILWRLVTENWGTIKTWFTELPGKIVSALGGLVSNVGKFVKEKNPLTLLFNAAKDAWPNLKKWFSERLTDIVGFLKSMPTRIKNAARGLWDGITDAFKGAINKIIDGWNAIQFKVPGFKIGPIGYSGFTLGLPNIPRLAKGGIVQPTPGGTIAQIAEAGRAERVEPLDPNGLSKRDKAMINLLAGPERGTVINVYPSAGMNERELADLVSRQLANQMRRGAA